MHNYFAQLQGKRFADSQIVGIAVALTIFAITFGTLFRAFSIPSLYNIGNYFSLAMAMAFLFIFTVFFLDLYFKAQQTQAK